MRFYSAKPRERIYSERRTSERIEGMLFLDINRDIMLKPSARVVNGLITPSSLLWPPVETNFFYHTASWEASCRCGNPEFNKHPELTYVCISPKAMCKSSSICCVDTPPKLHWMHLASAFPQVSKARQQTMSTVKCSSKMVFPKKLFGNSEVSIIV